jgi:hypothetical protein
MKQRQLSAIFSQQRRAVPDGVRIAVNPDDPRPFFQSPLRIAARAEGAVNNKRARPGGDRLHHLVKEHRNMTGESALG